MCQPPPTLAVSLVCELELSFGITTESEELFRLNNWSEKIRDDLEWEGVWGWQKRTLTHKILKCTLKLPRIPH